MAALSSDGTNLSTDLVTKPLYHSPWGLLGFQADHVARTVFSPASMAVWDTGLGKTHLAMATAAIMFEDGLIDLCLLVAEKNKLQPDEWPKDMATYTDLTYALYHGDVRKRAKIRDAMPQVLLSTYETIRNDAAHTVTVPAKKGKPTSSLQPHVLTERLLQCRSVFIVYDEMTKLGNRKSGLHKAHELMVSTLRKAGVEVRLLGLTATPIERSPDNHYDLGRILQPHRMPTVAKYQENYVAAKDFFGNNIKFKNLSPGDCAPGVTPFSEIMRPVVLRKRKTDPDVIDQFPKVHEEPPVFVHLDPRHLDFYSAIEEMSDGFDEWGQRQFWTLLRQIAGHPLSITRSKGKIAQQIVEAVGEEGLRSLGSAKIERLVQDLIPIVKGQGAQVVVFTFFANSVLPLLQEAMEALKDPITVAVNAPFLSDKERAENKAAFRAGEREVFLTSDAGAKGINLPEATYCFEYESAVTHANRTQRFNRIHRIDSKAQLVTFRTYVAYDTVEEAIFTGALRRNEWSETLLDDEDTGEDFISVEDRKRMLRMARDRAERMKRAV